MRTTGFTRRDDCEGSAGAPGSWRKRGCKRSMVKECQRVIMINMYIYIYINTQTSLTQFSAHMHANQRTRQKDRKTPTKMCKRPKTSSKNTKQKTTKAAKKQKRPDIFGNWKIQVYINICICLALFSKIDFNMILSAAFLSPLCCCAAFLLFVDL